MNKKNKRIREQIVNFLMSEFPDGYNWVREIDYDSKIDHNFLKEFIRNKLINNQTIKLRTPLTHYFNGRKDKNLPGVCLDIKINGPELDVCWKISDKFGTHYSIWDVHNHLMGVGEIIDRLRLLIEINYRAGRYAEIDHKGK